MKTTLEEKYNNVLALNIELEKIIEMQSIELMKKDREIRELKKYKKYYIENPAESVIGIL